MLRSYEERCEEANKGRAADGISPSQRKAMDSGVDTMSYTQGYVTLGKEEGSPTECGMRSLSTIVRVWNV